MNDHELDELRTQVFEALRAMFDAQQAELARGKSLDAQRLIQTCELLLRLTPAEPSAPEAAGSEHGARERLAALIEPQSARQQDEKDAEIARLTEEVERLRQAASAQPSPTETKASPDIAPTKEKWKAPESWKKGPPEPWRQWMGDGMSMRRIRPSDWGPI
jgi:hypothetical protein